jgi:cell division protein FtsA
LDIRSTEICAVVGERGVNNTFIIKSKYTCPYEGFAEGEWIDERSFVSAVRNVVKSTFSAVGDKIKTFHIGVPGEFVKLINTDKVSSFSAQKKITKSDVNNLINLSRPAEYGEWQEIKYSPLYYTISDKRRVIEPIGCISDTLQAKISFFQSPTFFIESVKKAFKPFYNVVNFNFIPQTLAQTNYLIRPDQRDNYAVLFDLGNISSSYTVACGNGIEYTQSFSLGILHIAALLMQELEIPYDVALTFIGMVNLNAKERLSAMLDVRSGGAVYSYSMTTLRDLIREGLDGICETVEECRQSFIGKDLSNKPIYITGEGIKTIRGTVEHISSRLVSSVEIVTPRLPYYDKPHFSSIFSLLSSAINQQ